MPPVGFGPKISALERAKIVRALDRAATVIGKLSQHYLHLLAMKAMKQKLVQQISTTMRWCSG
jgi:hypothetical protein